MAIRLARKKKSNLLLRLVYFLKNYFPLGAVQKARVFSDLEWIFSRMALETSFSVYRYTSHPLRQNSFLLSKLERIESILDVGCGNGELAAQMYDKCKFVTGIDTSRQAINCARMRFPLINFLHGAAENLPSRKYDLVVLSHVLEHLDDPESVLSSIKSIGKYLYIEVPDYESTFLNQFRLDLGSDLLYTDNDHVREFVREDIFNMLACCGMEVINFEARYGCLKFWCLVGR